MSGPQQIENSANAVNCKSSKQKLVVTSHMAYPVSFYEIYLLIYSTGFLDSTQEHFTYTTSSGIIVKEYKALPGRNPITIVQLLKDLNTSLSNLLRANYFN